MNNKNDVSKGKLSRRDFLKGSLAATLGMMTVGVHALAEETTSETTPEVSGSAQASLGTSVKKTYRVYETDVVVIGGGLAGTMAAHSALKQNVKVTVVDKGPFGHSGASGVNWGTDLNVVASEAGVLNVSGTGGLSDQQQEAAIAAAAKEVDIHELGTKSGSVYSRSADGNFEGGAYEIPGMVFTKATVYMPRLFAHYVKNLGAKILERTMVTDILTAEDGSVCGVVGLDIVGGEAVIIRAKAVVMAMGSSCWVYGWKTAGAKTSSGQESTGDGPAILLKHGLKVRNFENEDLYGYMNYPDGIAYAETIGVQASDHPYSLINNKGEYFMQKWADKYPELAANMTLNNYFAVIMAEKEAGNLTENGGYFLNITDMDSMEWMTFNRGRDKDIEEAFGMELGDQVELEAVPFTTPIRPELDPVTCETKIPGLFYANEQEDSGAMAGYCAITGYVSGKNAAEMAKQSERKAPSEEDAIAALEEIYSVFDRTGHTGKRPVEIQHMIQNVVFDKAFCLTTEEGLTEAIAELRRIKEDEIPNMVLVDSSRNCNSEWRQALEVPFMWQNAMAIATARLNRRESRGSHFRADYPYMDNDNLLKNLYISQDGDEFHAEFTDVVTNGISTDEVEAMLFDMHHILDDIRSQK